VSGGFGVLGRAVAATLASYGTTVASIDFAAAPTPPTGQAAGVHVYGGVDLADEGSANSVMTRIVHDAGRLDGLINIAGGFHWEILEGGALDTWDSLYRVNLRTAVVACKTALPFLLKSGKGRIVNIGAMGAAKAGPGMGPYAASKAGVAKLTEALAEELKDRGVTVNAILPSTIDTPRNRLDMPDADFSRWVAPSAIAEVIAFLLSDAAGAITGALIPVAGRV
jgi:NAD(P)-dependent dehydrogenase (short-subunit alcohol dehydrogenase family)